MNLRGIIDLFLRSPRRSYLCYLLTPLAVLLVSTVNFTLAQDKSATSVTPTPTPEIVQADVDEKPLKVQTDLVTLTLTVHDLYGRYVSNLEKKHFSIFEDDVEQEITFF